MDVFKEDCILPDLNARGKEELLYEMLTAISPLTEGLDKERVLKVLLEREGLGSTAMGHGVAFPHGKIKGLEGVRVFLGRSRRGIEFESTDKMPVHLFFLILSPENSVTAHLKILACLANLLKDPDFRSKLINAETGSEIYRATIDADRKNWVL